MTALVEPLALGFSSGLSCLGACGMVLAPWLASSGGDVSRTAAVLSAFLGGRLGGYLLFAVAAWGAAQAVPAGFLAGPGVQALVNGALAVLLGGWAWLGLARRAERCPSPRRLGLEGKAGFTGAALLGLATGVNVCPPFVAAATRAVAAGTLGGALLFFSLFFAGTAVWFVPFLATGWLRRFAQVAVVARMTLALLAAYYAYVSAVFLLARWRSG